MPRRIISAKEISVPEAKRVLEKVKEDELGEFQRRTLDYTIKFSKISATKAEKAVRQLSSKLGLERIESIQIVNCMPKTREELRTIISTKGRIVSTTQLDEIIELLHNIQKD